MDNTKLFLTGTMRTGGSLLINLLSAHPKILILNERVHFFRFIHNRFNPLNKENLDYLLNEQRLRLKFRKNIDLDIKYLRKKILNSEISYKNIYCEFMNYFLKNSNKSIWGEFAGLQWREIPQFIDFFNEGKVIHMFRDPRAVLASWKKLSSIPNNAYLNCIFNWIDSTNHLLKFKRILNENIYFACKYEDLMNFPKKNVSKLINYIGVKQSKILFQPDNWSKSFNPQLVTIPRSAHEGEKIIGFSKKRISNWKKNLEDWEIALVEFLCLENMKKLGYSQNFKNLTLSNKLIKKAIMEMKKNKLIYSNYNNFLKNGIGTNQYPLDPTDPRSWGQKTNPSKWFIDSEEGKNYLQELAKSSKKITEKYL